MNLIFVSIVVVLLAIFLTLANIASSQKKIAEAKKHEMAQIAKAKAEELGERILDSGTAKLLAIDTLAEWGLEIREGYGIYPEIVGNGPSIELRYGSINNFWSGWTKNQLLAVLKQNVPLDKQIKREQ